jgi:acetyl-CoA synthetase
MSGVRTIRKSAVERARSNMPDYGCATAELSWDVYRSWLDYLPGGALNIAYEAVDRHVAHGRGEQEALRWIGRGGGRRSFSYADLKRETDRFARLLSDLGHGPGARVFSLLGRVPDLYFAALGTLKAGGVFSPLYSAFGPEPVHARMSIGEAAVLVTTAADYEKKVRSRRGELPHLRHVLLVDGGQGIAEVIDLPAALDRTRPEFQIASTRPEDMALLHFTSGTTGRPKGAIHVHEAVVAHHATGRLALDLHEDDIFWCTADPGWVTGTSYGIIAPLTNGVTMVVDEGEFDAERWYSTSNAKR